MKYISKGVVVEKSTEAILNITRCGVNFQLTGEQAALWLNGRFGFAEADDGNPILHKALTHLLRQELVEPAENGTVGEYRALTQCVIVPAKVSGCRGLLSKEERRLLKWIREAGLRLTMAELVFLTENGVAPEEHLLGEKNRQRLTEEIYTADTIFDNILESKMEHAKSRDAVVRTVLQLLRKKRILLL